MWNNIFRLDQHNGLLVRLFLSILIRPRAGIFGTYALTRIPLVRLFLSKVGRPRAGIFGTYIWDGLRGWKGTSVQPPWLDGPSFFFNFDPAPRGDIRHLCFDKNLSRPSFFIKVWSAPRGDIRHLSFDEISLSIVLFLSKLDKTLFTTSKWCFRILRYAVETLRGFSPDSSEKGKQWGSPEPRGQCYSLSSFRL